MQLGRTSALISRLRAHMEATSISQVALSKELGLSPQNLSLILRGTNCPNSETTLQIIEEILRTDKNMTTPKTLGEAKEMIDDLRAELKLLKSASALAASTPKPPTVATPTTPAAPNPATTARSTDMVNRPERPLTEIDKLRSQLNVTKDDGQRVILYKRIKQAERDARL